MTLTFGSLFAGIGGFDEGFHRAGLECLWQVELEPDCRSVLGRHFPAAQRFADVREVGRHNLKPVDVICGGFPCQDLSVAGKREGLGGARSGLFHEMVRITDELRPMVLVWENVPGLLSSFSPVEPPPDAVEGSEWEVEEDSDFETVLYQLDAIGYSGGWTGLDAQWFGVAQRRQRIFGVFARRDIGAERCAEILSLREGLRRHPPTRRQKGERVADSLTVGANQYSGFNGEPVEQRIAPTLRSNGDAHSGFRDDGGLVTNCFNGYTGGAGLFVPSTVYATDGMAFAQNSRDEVRLQNGDGQISGALASEPGMKQTTYASTSTGVRRLTPTECERLQGFDDSWTAWGVDEAGNKILMSDSARYRMLGNAVCVNVAEWIGRRIIG